ncbi:MAG TPA: LysR substrate-binding domain-containing protein [Steroidobacteraceae bacterium]|nr:LysR substrate-binding domain-containing protein [Steroidobacteraceae bacterium]
MTLRELRYLVALADQEHFGRAAEECCVSQSTLSTQIKKLEGYLGVTLIERNAGSFSLTPVGQDIVAKARRIVRQVDDLQITARTALGPLVGPLRLGVIPTLAPYYLPSFVPLVKGQYQRLQLVFHEDLTQHLVERLRNYEIDAALLALPLDGEDFEELPLFDEPFWLACPPGHSLADSKTITQADLRGVPLLLLADGHCLRGQALAACGRFGDEDVEEVFDDFRAVSLETICQLVASGFGCTLLPALAALPPQRPAPSFVMRPLHSPNDSRRIGLVWRRGYPKAQELALLGDLIIANLPAGTRSILKREGAVRAHG